MRKSLTAIVLLLTALANSSTAQLIDNGDGTVTDNDRGDGTALMWLQTPGPDNSFNGAQAWADSLVFAGHDDWRLPSALDFTTGLPDEWWWSTNNEFGHLYGVELGNPPGPQEPLRNYRPLWFWTGTADPDSSGDAFAFFWSWDGLWGIQSSADRPDMTGSSFLHVTAVRDIGPPPDCLGDLDGDGVIMISDLGRLISLLGQAGPPYRIMEGDPLWDASADMDGNGIIMISDLGQLISILGAAGPPYRAACP